MPRAVVTSHKSGRDTKQQKTSATCLWPRGVGAEVTYRMRRSTTTTTMTMRTISEMTTARMSFSFSSEPAAAKRNRSRDANQEVTWCVPDDDEFCRQMFVS